MKIEYNTKWMIEISARQIEALHKVLIYLEADETKDYMNRDETNAQLQKHIYHSIVELKPLLEGHY